MMILATSTLGKHYLAILVRKEQMVSQKHTPVRSTAPADFLQGVSNRYLDVAVVLLAFIAVALLPSAPSRLNFRVANTVDFREPSCQQGGSHEQEVYRAAHGRGTDDLRSDHQGGKGQVGETAAGDDLAQGRRRRAGLG